MKNYKKGWSNFLLKEHALENYEEQLEYNEEGEVVLYHVSSTEGLKALSPQIARAGIRNYTKKEYRTWNRPRVFFFTRSGQEDVGVGKIQGKVTYRAEIDKEKLYPVMKDPLKFSFPENEKEYLNIREATHGMPSYYPINRYEMVATLAEREGYHGFIYPQKEGYLIVALWEAIEVTPLEEDFYQIGDSL